MDVLIGWTKKERLVRIIQKIFDGTRLFGAACVKIALICNLLK